MGLAYLGSYLRLMLRSAELLPVATFCAHEQQAAMRLLILTYFVTRASSWEPMYVITCTSL